MMNLHGSELKMTIQADQSNRRLFLGQSLGGLGALALSHLLNKQTSASDVPAAQPPRARAVISLFQHGGPSHVDMFDPKPMLTKMHGKTYSGDLTFRSPTTAKRILGSPFEFAKHGKSGIELSELLPHTAEIVDDMTLIRSMKTKASDHTAAIRLINTGQFLPGSPVLGSWVVYGLGADTDSLPAYVVLVQGSYPTDGVGNWSSGWLPAEYQGTPFRSGSSPVQYLKTPSRFTTQSRSGQLDLLGRLNRLHQTRHPQNNELLARIKDFETAARMQVAVPEVLDFSDEPRELLKMYGLESPNPKTRDYARRCLLSRRLVERGVRFVQVCMASQPWDTHNKNVSRLKDLCQTTDQPSAALVKDLKQRGLLDETIVMWGGEFGREPISEGADGRDHNPRGFSLWLAGGGFKAGYVHGETDEIGYQAVSNVVTVHSLHATILHSLGIDHRKLTVPHDGRDVSLVDSPVTGEDIVPELLG
jgi:Protein of unknown function (DUF1501)